MSTEGIPKHTMHESERPWKYAFPALRTEKPYAFRRKDGNIYLSLHFNGEHFRHPETREDISVHNFLREAMNEFGVDSLTISSCYPEKAREMLKDMPNVTVLGSGNCEVRTTYNEKTEIVTVKSCEDK